jgi:hypothetical protein
VLKAFLIKKKMISHTKFNNVTLISNPLHQVIIPASLPAPQHPSLPTHLNSARIPIRRMLPAPTPRNLIRPLSPRPLHHSLPHMHPILLLIRLPNLKLPQQKHHNHFDIRHARFCRMQVRGPCSNARHAPFGGYKGSSGPTSQRSER